MINDIKIADTIIDASSPPFIIAEMSGNHNQSIARSLEIVEAAARSGVNALKIQTYTPDTMTLDLNEREFRINDAKSLWNGRSLYELYTEAYTPWEWHDAIFEKARQLGLIVFSSPFDEAAVDFLESLNAPCYKIASFENTDLPLIKKVAKTGKPMMISTGMASIAELGDAVSAARQAGCKDLILLKCTSTYPADPENTNLLTIPHMRELFQCQIGLSDHSGGVGVAVASIALGAVVIEKHFTLSRSEGGIDSAFSMEPIEMEQMVIETTRAWRALGHISYGATDAEKRSLQFRRSIYVVKDIYAGEMLTHENVRIIRPGFGLPPKYIEVVIGKQVNIDIKRGTALSWDMF